MEQHYQRCPFNLHIQHLVNCLKTDLTRPLQLATWLQTMTYPLHIRHNLLLTEADGLDPGDLRSDHFSPPPGPNQLCTWGDVGEVQRRFHTGIGCHRHCLGTQYMVFKSPAGKQSFLFRAHQHTALFEAHLLIETKLAQYSNGWFPLLHYLQVRRTKGCSPRRAVLLAGGTHHSLHRGRDLCSQGIHGGQSDSTGGFKLQCMYLMHGVIGLCAVDISRVYYWLVVKRPVREMGI